MASLLVIVTGEPGSGKSELGRRLSAALRVPFLSRDDVRGGMLATAGLWTNELADAPPREAAVEAFVRIVETMAEVGASGVVEFVVTPSRTEALDRLKTAAHAVVIVTSARDAADRATHRDRTDPFFRRPGILDALGHETIDDFLDHPERERVRAQMRTDLGLPTLDVATDDGYDPALPDIVEWIIEQARRR